MTLHLFPTSTFKDIANQMLDKLIINYQDVVPSKTMRRRVYDAFNIFTSTELLSKNSKSIIFQPDRSIFFHLSNKRALIEEAEQNIKLKQEQLISKIQLLINLYLIIQRNSTVLRPKAAIQLPIVLIGYSTLTDGRFIRSLVGHYIDIISPTTPVFYSPADVFKTLLFTTENKITIYKMLPQLAPLEHYFKLGLPESPKAST
jgi:hypothetical protein